MKTATPAEDLNKPAAAADTAAAAATGAEGKEATTAKAGKPPENEEAIREFLGDFLPKPKEDKKKPAEKSDDKTAKPGEKKEDKVEKAAPKPKAKPAPAPLTREDLVDTVRTIVSESAKTTAKPSPEKVEEDAVELPEEEKRTLEVLRVLEKKNPSKYADLSKKHEGSLKRAIAYADKWEKANPGKEFDENDPEHAEFFEENDVDWSEADFRAAEIELAADKMVTERMKPVSEEMEEFKREKRLAAAEPDIKRQRDSAASEFWKEMGGDFAGFLKEDGTVDPEVAKKLSESDPIGRDYAIHYAQNLVEPVAAEIHKLAEGLVKYDSKNRMHSDINDFAVRQENALMELESEKRVDEKGRKFVTSAEFVKLSPAEQKTHWTLTGKQLTVLWAASKAKEVSKLAAARREEVKKYAGAYGGKAAEVPTEKKAAEADDDADETVENNGRKPITPSTSGGSKVAASAGSKAGQVPEAVKNWLKDF